MPQSLFSPSRVISLSTLFLSWKTSFLQSVKPSPQTTLMDPISIIVVLGICIFRLFTWWLILGIAASALVILLIKLIIIWVETCQRDRRHRNGYSFLFLLNRSIWSQDEDRYRLSSEELPQCYTVISKEEAFPFWCPHCLVEWHHETTRLWSFWMCDLLG